MAPGPAWPKSSSPAKVGQELWEDLRGTHPDFVILRLVLQVLIKLLLGVEFDAVDFELLTDLQKQRGDKSSRSSGSAQAHRSQS